MDASILNPTLNMQYDKYNQTKGYLNIIDNMKEINHPLDCNNKFKIDDNKELDAIKNTTGKNSMSERPNYDKETNSDNNLNQLINKNLSEELLNSFKNLFSNIASNKEKNKQTLNLYLNGNISINLLTGNTNPQIITNNVYNKDSYNTNKTTSYNINSKNKQNNTFSSLKNETEGIENIDLIKKIPKKSFGKNKNKNFNEDLKSLENKHKKISENLDFDENIKNKKINKSKTKNEELQTKYNNTIKSFLNEEQIKTGQLNSTHNLIFNNNESSNSHNKENRKKLEITEDYMQKLLEDDDLKKYLNKKIETLRKIISKNKNRIHIDHTKTHEDNSLTSYFNMDINKTLEEKMLNEHLLYEKNRQKLIKDKKNSNSMFIYGKDSLNKTKKDPNLWQDFNYFNFTRDSNSVKAENASHVQNNYYINDHSIKIINSENPSIVAFNNKLNEHNFTNEQNNLEIINKKPKNLKNNQFNISDNYPNQVVYINNKNDKNK